MVRTIKLGHLPTDASNQLTKNQTKNLDKYSRRNGIEMLKYFILHTSLHGLKYTKDKKLYKIERIFWALICITALYFCSNVIFQLYEGFQSEHTHIHIDKVDHGTGQIPFPSVTFCSGTIFDWKKAIQVVNNLTRSGAIHKNDTSTLLDIMAEIAKFRFSRLSDLKIDFKNSAAESLKDINLAWLSYNAMPSCEQLFFNCSWSYDIQNCCDIFETQKTAFGFCYAFNSLTSINNKYKTNSNLLKANNYGIRGGLTFSIRYDNIVYPPDIAEKDTGFIIITSPDMYPSKARKVRLRKKYNIDINFMCAFASPEVIRLENSTDPLCKCENGTYNYKKCLDWCEKAHVRRMCQCNPTFLFASNARYRDCTIQNLECLVQHSKGINTLSYSENSNEDEESCQCIIDCNYCYYDDHVTGFDHGENTISVDVHYEGPTGILYRRDLVVSGLDILVQLGSIFGLFLGGSLITLTELVYFCLVGSVYSIYHFFITFKNRRNSQSRPKGLIVINVLQYSENGDRHVMDFPIKLKQ